MDNLLFSFIFVVFQTKQGLTFHVFASQITNQKYQVFFSLKKKNEKKKKQTKTEDQ